MGELSKAFILGAGLGTRLRPLTEYLPKPLVPVWNRPLICYAFDHLIADLGAKEFILNTHHCPSAYDVAFPDGEYRGRPVEFRHEPVLLDTAGGISNILDWLPTDEPFAVYNGDLITDLPLRKAWERHCRSGDAATLVLRSTGAELRVGFDPDTGRVVDLRGLLNPDWPNRFQFTGIYFVSPDFYEYLVPGKIESVVIPFIKAIEDGNRIGGVVVDDGEWSDLGERNAYLAANRLIDSGFPRYDPSASSRRISPEAEISGSATIDRYSAVGPGAVVGDGAQIVNSVVWAGATVSPGANLDRVVVRDGKIASGNCRNTDL